jgi:L-cysteine desulfidase
MAARSWITSIGTALGVAAGAGAAQLGIGYGLNIVTWAPATDEETARTLWLASLAWVAWLAANSTVIGALCADRRVAG